MKQINLRAQILVDDIMNVFFDDDIQVSPDLQPIQKIELNILYNKLMEIITHIQLQYIEEQGSSYNTGTIGMPFQRKPLFQDLHPNDQPKDIAFEIMFNDRNHHNLDGQQQQIFTIERETGNHMEIPQNMFNQVTTPRDFNKIIQELTYLKLARINTQSTSGDYNISNEFGQINNRSSINKGSQNVGGFFAKHGLSDQKNCNKQEFRSSTPENKDNHLNPFGKQSKLPLQISPVKPHDIISSTNNTTLSADDDNSVEIPPLNQINPLFSTSLTSLTNRQSLQERTEIQLQKKKQITEEKLQQIKQKNQKYYNQHLKAQELKNEKIQQALLRQQEKENQAENIRKQYQEQRIQNAARIAEKIQKNKQKKIQEREQLLQKINKNWEDNERRRRIFLDSRRKRASESLHRQQHSSNTQDQSELQQVLWQGFEGLFTENFLDELKNLTDFKPIHEMIQSSQQFDVQRVINIAICALQKGQLNVNNNSQESIQDNSIQTGHMQTSQSEEHDDIHHKLTENDLEAMLYICFYHLFTDNKVYTEFSEQQKEKLSVYERQILYPQMQTGEIYQIPGILNESFILFAIYLLLKEMFQLNSKKTNDLDKQKVKLTEQQLQQQKQTAAAQKKFKKKCLKHMEQFMATEFDEQQSILKNNSNTSISDAIICALIYAISQKLEFPVIFNRYFIKEVETNHVKRFYLYDLLSSTQISVQLLQLLINNGYVLKQETYNRIFNLVIDQATQIVLTPHIYIDDIAGQNAGIVTNKVMLQEYATILQVVIQLLNLFLSNNIISLECTQPLRALVEKSNNASWAANTEVSQVQSQSQQLSSKQLITHMDIQDETNHQDNVFLKGDPLNTKQNCEIESQNNLQQISINISTEQTQINEENNTIQHQSPELCCLEGNQLQEVDQTVLPPQLEQNDDVVPISSPPSVPSQNQLNWGAGLEPHWSDTMENLDEPGVSFSTNVAEDPLLIQKQLHFILNYSLSPKIYYFPSNSLYNNTPTPCLIFLPRVNNNNPTIISLYSNVNNEDISKRITMQKLETQLKLRPNRIFTKTGEIQYQFEITEDQYNQFAQFLDQIVTPGLLASIHLFKNIAQYNIFDKQVTRNKFKGLLENLPFECFVSKQTCELLNNISDIIEYEQSEKLIGIV